MAFGSFSGKNHSGPMAEINMVPLIDVMLVLLVIFIITAPLLTHSVKINLPTTSSHPMDSVPDKIDLAIQPDGSLYWNGEVLELPAVIARLQEAGRKTPAPELHIRADRDTRYQALAEVMAEAAKAGVSKIGFVSEPGGAPAAATTP